MSKFRPNPFVRRRQWNRWKSKPLRIGEFTVELWYYRESKAIQSQRIQYPRYTVYRLQLGYIELQVERNTR